MWSGWRLGRAGEVAVLALAAYLPALFSSPGRVSADSRQALYVDPGEFLSRAALLWDSSFGAGTVPHQHIGYLWPVGPWFWFFDLVGVPTWVAQRLWWGTLIFAAALGMRWLARSLGASSLTATAVALVYAFTPYQLAFTARVSVLLLPWVGLPWLTELTRRAVHHGGWRHPALFALVLTTTAGVNLTALALVALGPLLVLVAAGFGGRGWGSVMAVMARLGAVSLAVSAWWLVGLSVQGSYGLPVLQLTENLTDIARWSSPGDVLRGLGNWFFAGRDRLGYSIDQAELYLDRRLMVAVTLVLPTLALTAAVLTRGRTRLFALAGVVLAMAIGVGAWPVHQPTVFGRGFTWFVEQTSAGLALRNSHRVVPVLVMGTAVLLAVGIERLPRPRWRTAGAAAVGALALAGLAPVLVGGFGSRHLDRDEDLPSAWLEAAEFVDTRAEDAVGNPWRVLEVPGSPFAAHRWGNTVEPVLVSLTRRPHLAREVLPYGSAATANLLDAFDRRMQEGVFEPETVAPIARLFSASEVVVRSDLQFERFAAPEPAHLWSALSGSVPGVQEVHAFGEPTVNEPDRRLAPISERDLNFASLVASEPAVPGSPIPPVGVLSVADAPPLLQVLAADEVVVMAGDGDGIVDAAAAGLIDGRTPIIYADALDDAALDQVIDAGAHLVLTDSNRRRIQTWFYAIRDTRGPTEQAGETLAEPSGYDHRIEPVPGLDDASRSVVEQRGAQVSATATGGAARPEDRAVAAFDGDLATSWRVGGADPRGHRLMIEFPAPRELDLITIVQPLDGPRDRVLERLTVHTDGQPPFDVMLGPESLTSEGQVVTFPARVVNRMEVEITGVSIPPFDPALANAVGVAEIGIDGLEVHESVVLPPSLISRLGDRVESLGIDVVMTRLRYDPYDRGRTDAERRLHRTVDLPGVRSFQVSGSARINPSAPDTLLDELLGTTSAVGVRASSRLTGDLSARARSAVDGRSDTAWTAAFGEQAGQWIELELGAPRPVTSIEVGVVVDELHSAPALLAVEIDGEVALRHSVDLPAPGPPGTVHLEQITLPGGEVGRIRLIVEEVRRISSPPGEPAVMATLPVAITELGLDGQANLEVGPDDRIDTGCRSDLLSVDGAARSIRISGPVESARTGLAVEACSSAPGGVAGADGWRLGGGRVVISSTGGHLTGLDIDRLVLSSGADGEARPPETRGRVDTAAARLVEVDAGRVRRTARVETDGSPFWLVSGQSNNPGWRLTVNGAQAGPRTLINGFADGWEIAPSGTGVVEIALEWTPQRQVWWALGFSLLAVSLALGYALGTPRLAVPRGPLATEPRPLVAESPTRAPVVATAVIVGLLTALVCPAWMGVVAVLVVVIRALVPASALVWAGVVPLVIIVSLVFDRSTLPWLALAVAVAAVAGAEAADRWSLLRVKPREEAEARSPTPASPEPLPTDRGSGDPRGHDPGT